MQVADEIRASGGEAVANGDDISDWNVAKRLIDQAVETFGRLDVVINNAGILRDRMLANMSEEEWTAPPMPEASRWRPLNLWFVP